MKKLALTLIILILCGCQTTNVFPQNEIYQYDKIDNRTDYPIVIYETNF